MSPQKNLTIATSNDQADSVLPINKLQVAEKQYKKMEIKFNNLESGMCWNKVGTQKISLKLKESVFQQNKIKRLK